jgi:CBS domain-containing protein
MPLPLAAMLGSYPAHRRFSSPLETPTTDCPNWIERKIGCLPVVETGRVVGILTEAEIVQSICDGSQPPTLSKLRGSCSC